MVISVRSFALYLSAFFGLTGCFPIVETIYRPEVPGGQLSGPYCGGRYSGKGLGPKEIVTIVQAGVRVELRASDRSFDERGEAVQATSNQSVATVSFLVVFVIPEGVTFRLLSSEFVVFEPDRNAGINYSIPDLSHFFQRGGRIQRVLSTNSILGETVTWWGSPLPERYWGSFTTTGPLPEYFTLAMPRALVNGQTVEFPKVGFRRATESWVSLMNC